MEKSRSSTPGRAFARLGGFYRRQRRAGFLFALPWIVGILVFYALPLLTSICNSFFEFKGLDPVRFVGLGNYGKLFTVNRFQLAVVNTLEFAVMSVPLSLFFSILTALLINVKTRLKGFYRVVSFIPTLMPAVATCIVWMWMLNAQFGIINTTLARVGILGPPWLTGVAWTKPSLVLIGMWGVGGAVLTYLAGLQDIPRELYEAARIDGAGSLAVLTRITLPLLTPVIYYNLIMSLIGAFQQFTSAFVMTRGGGGPGESLFFYATLMYQYAFRYFELGMANALAWIMFVVVALFTILVQLTSARWVHYLGE